MHIRLHLFRKGYLEIKEEHLVTKIMMAWLQQGHISGYESLTPRRKCVMLKYKLTQDGNITQNICGFKCLKRILETGPMTLGDRSKVGHSCCTEDMKLPRH